MRPPRLLVLDDEPEIGRLFQKVAEGLGFEMRTAQDVATFREIQRSFAADVVVLDLVIPERDGIELLRVLAAEGCHAQVLMMSGYDAKLLEAARRLGEAWGLTMSGVITKPFRAADLQAVLQDVKDQM
jgi:CheY-like chemotaxis protein